jgi:hypothetical protein
MSLIESPLKRLNKKLSHRVHRSSTIFLWYWRLVLQSLRRMKLVEAAHPWVDSGALTVDLGSACNFRFDARTGFRMSSAFTSVSLLLILLKVGETGLRGLKAAISD